MLNNGERQVAPILDGIRADHRARYEWAAKQLPARSRVIDIACGVGYGAKILAEAGHTVIAIDRDPEAIAYAREHYAHPRVTHHVAEAETVRLDDEPVDAAVCFETLEHLEDPVMLLKKLHLVAPFLLASVPNEAVFPHRGRVAFHHRHYTAEEFRDLLHFSGFLLTEWHGQLGPESPVQARRMDGRTLIAVAHAVSSFTTERADPPAPKKGVPDHVAIVGLGPSCAAFFQLAKGLGGVSAYCDEVWGINAMGDVLRCDRIFHMDDLRIQEARAAARPDSNIAAMVRWLKTHPGPVYTSVVREGYPGLVAFPLEEVLNGGYDSAGGVPYFNSTAAYAIAYAVHVGVKKISLFGMDFTLANAHKAEKGRACCEFWLGIAAARGIEINVSEHTSLLDACETPEMRLYGYDCVDVTLHDRDGGGVEVQFAERAVVPSAAEIEARYDHRRHPNSLVEKAVA
jgi:SAM-dependent methyltransferase